MSTPPPLTRPLTALAVRAGIIAMGTVRHSKDGGTLGLSASTGDTWIECTGCSYAWRRSWLESQPDVELQARFHLVPPPDDGKHALVWETEGTKRFTRVTTPGRAFIRELERAEGLT